jgi:hypothetical protein
MPMKPDAMELIVHYHQSGRYTLHQKSGSPRDDDGDGKDALLANTNKGDFYRAVAQRISDRVGEGWTVTYKDTTLA